MGKFLVCVLVATAGAMVAAQPQSPYYRGSSYRGLARDITDYGLFRLMSAIQGGGRGHREILGAASSIRNSLHPGSSSSSSYSPYQQGKHYGYLAPPPRGSKSYYYNPSGSSSLRGQKPEFLKDTYIIATSGGSPKSKSPYSFSQAVQHSGPTEYSTVDSEDYSPASSSSSSSSPSEYSSSSGSSIYSSPSSSPGSSVYSSPSSASGSSVYSSPSSSSGSSVYSSPTSSPYSSPSSESSSVYSSSAPPSSSGSSEYAASSSSQSSGSGPQTITVSSDEPLTLEQIVAKAAQEQHQKVLAREQQAHPGAQVTHQLRLAPQYQQSGHGPQAGSLPQQYRQILIQGQPGQLPPQYSPQQFSPQHQPQQVLIRGPPPPQFGGPNAPVPPHGQQIIIQGPNGQPMLLQLQPPQGQPQIQYVPSGPQPGQQIQYVQSPQQIRIAAQPAQGQQPGQPQLIQYQQIPQQGFPFGVPGQQYAGQQIYTLPGPHGFFPQQVPVAPEGLLGQPQFALPQQEQQQIQTNQIYNQPQQQQSGSEEQSTSSSEQSEQIASAESSVSVSSVEAPSSGESPLSSPGDSDPMTAALLHSHREYSEPVHKI